MALEARLGPRIGLTVEHSFWITALILGSASTGAQWQAMLLWLAVCFIGVLVHELGHALLMLRFGCSAHITFYTMGGVTRPVNATTPFTARQHLAVSAAGPVLGLLFGLAAFASRRWCYLHAPWQAYLFVEFSWRAALYWNAINLLPIEPMDGGQFASRALHARFGIPGLKAAYLLGIATAAGLGIYKLLAGQMIMAVMLGTFAFGIVQKLRQLTLRSPQDDDPQIQAAYDEAQALLAKDEAAAAQKLIAVRKLAKAGLIYASATEQLGCVFFRAGDVGAAYPLLSSVEASLAPSSRKVLQWLACEAGDYDRAISLGRSLFNEAKDAGVACASAASYAGLGDPERAAHWLKTAAALDRETAGLILKEKHFDRVRADPAFRDAVVSLGLG
ncbi:MAG: hypothetical protein HY078_14285 [Elusimicrobia bacterium]|nr:hypothetical protein [Elusimicrobiota bacterium]